MSLHDPARIKHVLDVLHIFHLILIAAVQKFLRLLFLFALVAPEGTWSSLPLKILSVRCCHRRSHPDHATLYR